MGVDRTDHIVYGWKLPCDLKNEQGEIDLWDDKYLPYTEGHPGIEYTIITDGMCGEYTVFGLDMGSCWGTRYEGWNFEPIDITKIDLAATKAKFAELFEMEPSSEPTLFIFSHFS
jgi:hypothetical protein